MSTFNYFAYGSNMLNEWLQDPSRCPSAQPFGIAVARRYSLSFCKRSSKDKSGKATLVKSTNSQDKVFGVLFKISDDECMALNRAEGEDYDRVSNFSVFRLPDAEEIEAVAYIAKSDKCDNSLAPYDWYHGLVIAGGDQHELPESYLNRLRQTQPRPIPDPNPKRPNRLKAMEALERAGFSQRQ